MPARRVLIDGVEQIDPRQTRAWRKLRDQVVVEEPSCRLAFPGICTRVSTTAAHIEPVAGPNGRPELALVRSNVVGSCEPCNRASGTLPRAALVLGGDRERDRPALAIFRTQ